MIVSAIPIHITFSVLIFVTGIFDNLLIEGSYVIENISTDACFECPSLKE